MPSLGQQYENIRSELGEIKSRLERIERGGAEPVRPPADIEIALRGAAADWMETEAGHVYGQTVLDILDNVR